MNINIFTPINYSNPIRQYDKKCYKNLTPLKEDVVSFGAKKSDFEGIDLLVVNQFVAPNDSRAFVLFDRDNASKDLQNWCKERIRELKNKYYKGRSIMVVSNREAILNEWYKVLDKDKSFSNAERFLIIESITSQLKEYNDKMPPVLNEKILHDTMQEIRDNSKTNKNYKVNFSREYEKKIKKHYLQELKDSDYTGWIIIPSKENDPDNFEDNIRKLKVLSHNNWCTKSFSTQRYLSQGNFHIYMENSEPKLGIRFLGSEIQEVQGEDNFSKIPIKYLDIVKTHTKNIKMNTYTTNRFKEAEMMMEKIRSIEETIGKPIEEASAEELFKGFDMLEKRDEKDGLLILKFYDDPIPDLYWDKLGIDENKLFKEVKEIEGDAIFFNSMLTDLGRLEKIGADAYFSNSPITNLGELKEIGGDAHFENSRIKDLGKLQKIGKMAFVSNNSNLTIKMLEERGFTIG